MQSEPGSGSLFEVYLPLIDAHPSQLEVRLAVGDLPRGTETVLVVEDEPLVRDVATMALNQQGYRLLEAGNGVDALRIVDEYDGGEISLVVTDVVMPLMGGKELAKQLALRHPHIKVLFTSGYTDDQFLSGGMTGDPLPFVMKPYRRADLANEVRELLDA